MDELELSWQVNVDCEGMRLDLFLTRQLAAAQLPQQYEGSVSRSYVQKLLKDKKVTVDGNEGKANQKLKKGQYIVLFLPKPIELEAKPENIPLDILYEDKDVILINKPKGMVVHPAAGHDTGTLVNALLYHCKGELSGIGGVMRPGIVHRIDMDTTGVLIACKTDAAHQSLSGQLNEHSITRKYLAIVHGRIEEDTLDIEGTIGRHPTDRKKMAMNVRNGKPACTHVKVLERFQNKNAHAWYTYIECRLETGRTHQIRVHLSSLHHPLLGDDVYGMRKEAFSLQGQTLHASVFGFIHPTSGEYMEFTAPLPEYFTRLLHVLRGMNG